MATLDPDLIQRAFDQLKCRDDSLSPEPDWVLCTELNNHHGDHVARGEGGRELTRWRRGAGRAAGELRKRLGLEPYR